MVTTAASAVRFDLGDDGSPTHGHLGIPGKVRAQERLELRLVEQVGLGVSLRSRRHVTVDDHERSQPGVQQP